MKKILFISGISLLAFVCIFFSCLFLKNLIHPNKIAILYLSTGRYIVFWDDFYKSMEKNFLPNYPKHYFIFTDNETIQFPKNVTKIQIPNLKFPEISLRRWELFLGLSETLKQFKYTYFLNGNAEVIRPVHEEILPTPEQELMVAWHPAYYKHRDINKFPYDRNIKSTAYIPYGTGVAYVQGGFNGGLTKAFLKMAEVCMRNTQINKKNGITARWHDESHLNKYILNKKPLIMDSRYIWAPFDWDYYTEVKDDIRIVMRNKTDPKYGGFNWLRGYTDLKENNSLSEADKKTGYHISHPYWNGWLIKKDNLFCRADLSKECADVEKLSDSEIIVHWKSWAAERFTFSSDKKVWLLKTENKPD